MRSPTGSPLCCAVKSLSRSRMRPWPNTGPVLSVSVSGSRMSGMRGERAMEDTYGGQWYSGCVPGTAVSTVDSSITVPSLDPFDGEGDALPHADAHGCKREPAAEFLELVRGRHHQPCAAHAKGMAERNGPAGCIHLLGIFRQAELPKACDRLAGKGLVELNPIEDGDVLPEARKKLSRGRHWPDAHYAGRHARSRHAQDARARPQSV